MSDEITITLPVSGKEVVIRNYTTKADRTAADELMYEGAYFTEKGESRLPMGNGKKVKGLFVKRLVKSIGGESKDVPGMLESLREEDYNAIDEAVDDILVVFDPKDQEAEKASKP